MKNLDELKIARKIKNAWENWNPHFEILTSGTGEKIIVFFLLDDTDAEWKLYQSIPEEVMIDFANYIDNAKYNLLERVGFELQYEDVIATEQLAADMSADLSDRMNQYEKIAGEHLSDLTYNTLFI